MNIVYTLVVLVRVLSVWEFVPTGIEFDTQGECNIAVMELVNSPEYKHWNRDENKPAQLWGQCVPIPTALGEGK